MEEEECPGGGNSKCKGPEAKKQKKGTNLVRRNRKVARVAGQLDRGEEEVMLMSQDAKLRFIFSLEGNH